MLCFLASRTGERTKHSRRERTGLDAVLEAVKLPAGITDLDTSLTNVDGDDLTHVEREKEEEGAV